MNESPNLIIKKPFGLSRRTAIIGGLAFLACCLYYYGYLSYFNAWLHRSKGEWGFLQREDDTLSKQMRKVRDPSYIFKHFKPVGPKIDKIHYTDELLDDKNINLISQIMHKETIKRGWDKADVSISRQIYAVPDYSWYRNQPVQYCMMADNYLRNHPKLQNLDFPKIAWESVLPGIDYSKTYQGKGLIGHSAFNIYKITIKNSKNRKESFTLPYDVFSYPLGSDTLCYLDKWFVYISASDPGCLVAPFIAQMFMALNLMEQREELINKFGVSETNAIETALAMAVSHTLASELSDKLAIPNGKEIMKKSLEEMLRKQDDSLIKGAVNFVEKQGIGYVAKLYQENPIEFRKQLQRY